MNHDPASLACAKSFLDKYGGAECWEAYMAALCTITKIAAGESIQRTVYFISINRW